MNFGRLTAIAGLLLIPATAFAGPIGYSFTISGNTNIPTFTLENTSGVGGENIVGFEFVVKQANDAFDAGESDFDLAGTGADTGATINSPAPRSQTLDIDYSDFQPGETHEFQIDLDSLTADATRNYEVSFFNNTGDNAMLTVFFAGGASLMLTLPDQPTNDTSYTFTDFDPNVTGSSPVPAPAGLALMGLGLAGLGVIRRRR